MFTELNDVTAKSGKRIADRFRDDFNVFYAPQ